MTRSELLLLIDELLENEPGTLTGGEALADIPRWDSLALIGFIALLDQHFGISVPAAKIAECRTVSDLMALTGATVQGVN